MIKLRSHLFAGAVMGLILLPAASHAATFKEIVDSSIVPFGDAVVALLYALCFIAFLIGMVRYFFSHSEESRRDGKKFALWGIIALAVLYAVWGILHFLLTVLMDISVT